MTGRQSELELSGRMVTSGEFGPSKDLCLWTLAIRDNFQIGEGASIPSFRLFYLKKEKTISLNSIHPNRCASIHFVNLHLTLSPFLSFHYLYYPIKNLV